MSLATEHFITSSRFGYFCCLFVGYKDVKPENQGAIEYV